MEVNLKIIGLMLVLLALIHGIFPKYFNWSDELQKVSLINRQIMYVHTLFIAVTLLLMGLLCITSSADMITTALGNKICGGFALFWALRLFIQFKGYSSKLWRGKRMETMVHVLFSLMWLYFTVTFFIIYFHVQLQTT